jgi:hypothetical protein
MFMTLKCLILRSNPNTLFAKEPSSTGVGRDDIPGLHLYSPAK